MRDEWNYEFRREEEETDLILARYLAYSGKREYELNGKDRFILKIAYLIKGRNHKIKGRYEDTEEYRQTMTVIAWAPKLLVLGGTFYYLLKFLYRIYRATH